MYIRCLSTKFLYLIQLVRSMMAYTLLFSSFLLITVWKETVLLPSLSLLVNRLHS